MSCKQDCCCYLCRVLDDFCLDNSGAVLSSTDNFIMMRPVSAQLRPPARNNQSRPVERKECQWSNRNFTVRATHGNEAAQPRVKLWKSSELLRNINGQSVRIENSKLTDDIMAAEGWVVEAGEDVLELKSGASGGVEVVVMNEQDYDPGTKQAYRVSQDKVIIRGSEKEVWQGAAEGYAVVW